MSGSNTQSSKVNPSPRFYAVSHTEPIWRLYPGFIPIPGHLIVANLPGAKSKLKCLCVLSSRDETCLCALSPPTERLARWIMACPMRIFRVMA